MIHKDFALWYVAWHVAWPFCMAFWAMTHTVSFPQLVAWSMVSWLCCAVCSLLHTKVAEELAKNFQHFQNSWLGRFTISMQCEHVPDLCFFLFAGPNTKSYPMLISGIDIGACQMANGPCFLSALIVWPCFFQKHDQESARCCRASVIFKGQLGVPLTVYPLYLLCSLGILGDYNP